MKIRNLLALAATTAGAVLAATSGTVSASSGAGLKSYCTDI